MRRRAMDRVFIGLRVLGGHRPEAGQSVWRMHSRLLQANERVGELLCGAAHALGSGGAKQFESCQSPPRKFGGLALMTIRIPASLAASIHFELYSGSSVLNSCAYNDCKAVNIAWTSSGLEGFK